MDEIGDNAEATSSAAKRPADGAEPERKRVKMPLPRELKEQLVADWEQITLEPRKWVPLPRTPTVRTIVADFVKSRSKDRRWADFGDAVVVYFDKALPKILLYRHEREQLDLVLRRFPDACPSDVFGAEHLVRLFAKFPELLVLTNLSDKELQLTKNKLGDLCKFLVKKKDQLFLQTYELREKLLDDVLQLGTPPQDDAPPSTAAGTPPPLVDAPVLAT